MKRIIVFGLGNMFRKYKHLIESKWEIVGVSDNYTLQNDSEYCFISPESLPKDGKLDILICTKNGFLPIFKQLMNYGITQKNIIGINELLYEEAVQNWKKEGSQLPPPAEYKRGVVQEYATNYSCKRFIETGTFYGEMIEAQLPNFENIASVELSEELYNKARSKFEGISTVHLYYGDSGSLLGKMIEQEYAANNTVFWLDGHYSGGVTAHGETETPIIKELHHISEKCDKGVVLIDDARCFTGEKDYPTLEHLKDYVYGAFNVKNWQIQNDIIRIVF